MTAIGVPIRRLPHARDLPLPAYATGGSAGMDLVAATPADLTLAPGDRAAIPCGIALALPEGFEGQVRARSGLALRHGIGLVNAPGTIDADYRGEVAVIAINLGDSPFVIERGMRIAQLIVAPVAAVRWTELDVLPESRRGSGGFGSTGLSQGD